MRALTNFMKAESEGKLGEALAWSAVFCKHSKEAAKMMEIKRVVLLDYEKVVSGPTVSEETREALQRR